MEELKNYLLNNVEILKNVVNELNGWNNCLDYLDYYTNDELLWKLFGNNVENAVRAVCFGNYNFYDDYVRFDAYGNLQSCNKFELSEELCDNIDEIIDNLIEYKDDICIDDWELKELLNECEV